MKDGSLGNKTYLGGSGFSIVGSHLGGSTDTSVVVAVTDDVTVVAGCCCCSTVFTAEKFIFCKLVSASNTVLRLLRSKFEGMKGCHSQNTILEGYLILTTVNSRKLN